MNQEPGHPPELLSPAGDWDCARAAVAAGADAIYFGLPQFNARLRADNFTNDDLPELIDFLHRHGVRAYVTMNTLIFTGELPAAEAQLRLLERCGVDGVLIQDLGLARMAMEFAPSVEIHASTQMTISSPEGLAFVESLVPLQRAVLARELSIREISRFRRSSLNTSHFKLETPLEVFVHGALCVAYSGQCLTSESLGQRSANRGECAQACRMPYELVVDGETRPLGEQRYLLSPQDLAAVDLLPDLIAAGVRSFKIEGRLKSPEYVAAVTRIYRTALDAAAPAGPSSFDTGCSMFDVPARYALEMTFSRGLSTGWLAGNDHPRLTHGRFGKKRGPFLGTITDCAGTWIEIDPPPGSLTPPLKPGDGVVFDAGENRDLEQGARIWKIDGRRIIFHRTYSGINFERIRPGHTLYKTSDPALESAIRRFWQNARPPEKKNPIHLTVSGRPGEPLVLSASFDVQPSMLDVQCSSPSPLQPAAKHPLDSETLRAQLGRLGGTRYELATLDNRLEGGCHLPLSQLNQLRRDLVTALEARRGAKSERPSSKTTLASLLPEPNPQSATRNPQLSVLCRTPAQLAAAIECAVPVVYCDYEDPRRYPDAVASFRQSAIRNPQSAICNLQSAICNPQSAIFLATPRILKPGETGYLRLIERAAPDGLLLRNLAALEYYKHRSDFRKIPDFSLNIANPLSARLLMEAAAPDWLTISYDLNISQVLDLLRAAPPGWFELVLHQHMPLFHMEHCVFCAFMSDGHDHRDCGRPCENHVVHLRDRVGQLHRLQADVGCRNTLFNGRAQTGARFLPALRAAGLSRFRVELLDESHSEALATIRAYQLLLAGDSTPAVLLDQVGALEKLGVTEGTLR